MLKATESGAPFCNLQVKYYTRDSKSSQVDKTWLEGPQLAKRACIPQGRENDGA